MTWQELLGRGSEEPTEFGWGEDLHVATIDLEGLGRRYGIVVGETAGDGEFKKNVEHAAEIGVALRGKLLVIEPGLDLGSCDIAGVLVEVGGEPAQAEAEILKVTGRDAALFINAEKLRNDVATGLCATALCLAA